MKNARILLALILCTTVFYSCTTDDLYEDELATTEQKIFAKEGDEIPPLDPGDDDDGEPEPPDDD